MSHKRYYAKAGLLWIANLWRKKEREFVFNGKRYSYFHHPYNFTWLNERCVEIPIARDIMSQYHGKKILEVGNVLSRYDSTLTHTVVDKYETSSRPNYYVEDAETFTAGAPYDLIISISTLEHVGWDETPRDPEKIGRTIKHLRGLLSEKGRLFFTAPVGYSPPLNESVDILQGKAKVDCLKRSNVLNEWSELSWSDARQARFHHPYPFANGLMLVSLGRD